MDLNVVKKMNENRNEIGIYVQSFDMKYPMDYWEGNPARSMRYFRDERNSLS